MQVKYISKISAWINQGNVSRNYLSDRSLDISDDRSVRIIKKFNTNLCHITSTASSTKNFVYFSEFNSGILKEKKLDI